MAKLADILETEQKRADATRSRQQNEIISHVVLELPETLMPKGEDYTRGFENWKTTIPVAQAKEKP